MGLLPGGEERRGEPTGAEEEGKLKLDGGEDMTMFVCG